MSGSVNKNIIKTIGSGIIMSLFTNKHNKKDLKNKINTIA